MTRPRLSDLTTIAVKGKGARPESLPATPKDKPKALSYRPPADLYRRLRRRAFEEERPMQQLIDDAVRDYLSKAHHGR